MSPSSHSCSTSRRFIPRSEITIRSTCWPGYETGMIRRSCWTRASPARFRGLRLAAIGGIWAKSHAKPHYVTDADVAESAARIARSGPIDILITHACPVGLADLTPSGKHGGQRCFLEANKTIMPRVHLCGHLHVAQERTLGDGRRIINVGATPEGSFARVEFDQEQGSLVARLEQVPDFVRRWQPIYFGSSGFCVTAVVTSTEKPCKSFDLARVPLTNRP